jgi:gamma-glutamyltranspeptidase/glutathione hydrolase
VITRPDGGLRAVVGTMGGDTQPQVLLQLITRLLRHHQSAGTAIGAPRWALHQPAASGFETWLDADATVVDVEAEATDGWVDGLRERGHTVEVIEGVTASFGHAQLIEVTETGVAGAADPRALVGDAVGY